MKSMKKSKLSQAVHLALCTGLAISVGGFNQANAQEEAKELEKVEVTGSRIKRLDVEGASPVTVITREDIELSGFKDVAEFLRSTVYNSVGSFRPRSGTSFGANALIDLRGLGPDRTAVLINGLRVPGSPFTGSSAVDLSTLPIVAIDRIEILTDSASAVYGADAIGGVINVVLRKEYEGVQATYGESFPTRDGGDESWGSVVMGGGSAKSNFVFGADVYKRKPIFDRDRDYSAASFIGDGTEGTGDVVGVSDGGNTAFTADFSNATAYGDCNTDVYAGIFTNPFGVPGTSCGFAYADVSIMTAEQDRATLYFNGNYEVNDDVSLGFSSRATQIESLGRYAPAVGFFLVDANSPFPHPFADIGRDDEDYYLFHRFVGHGPRDDRAKTNEFDTVLSAQGAFGSVDWDAFVRRFTYDSIEYGDNYVLTSNLEAAVADGSYNILDPLSQDPDHLAAVAATRASLSRDLQNTTDMLGASFTGTAFDLPAGPIGWAAGFEAAQEDYKDIYDAAREAGNVLGSAGNSAAGDRDRTALFGEASFPVVDMLELNAAVRWDNYSDFDSEFSPQISFRLQPFDIWMVRGSYGEGFKAPNLSALHGATSQSFEFINDFTQCRAQGILDEDCPEVQVETFIGSNEDLGAETSESFNLGTVVEPLEQLTISADYWEIELTDAVAFLDVQTLINLEADGQPLPSGTALNRATPGDPTSRLVSVETGFANVASFETKGWDLKVTYEDEFSFGDILATFQYAHYLEYNFTADPTGSPEDLVETEGFPKNRFNLNARWNYDIHTVNYTVSWIGETNNSIDEQPGYDAFTRHDVTYTAELPWKGRVNLGVRNLFDEDPPLDPIGGYDADFVPVLYDVDGRVLFLQYSQDL